jgi:hypothetical protein
MNNERKNSADGPGWLLWSGGCQLSDIEVTFSNTNSYFRPRACHPGFGVATNPLGTLRIPGSVKQMGHNLCYEMDSD